MSKEEIITNNKPEEFDIKNIKTFEEMKEELGDKYEKYMYDYEDYDYDFDNCDLCGSSRCSICGEMPCYGCSCDDEEVEIEELKGDDK